MGLPDIPRTATALISDTSALNMHVGVILLTAVVFLTVMWHTQRRFGSAYSIAERGGFCWLTVCVVAFLASGYIALSVRLGYC